NPHRDIASSRRQTLQFIRAQNALERLHQGRQRDGQFNVMKQPAQVLQRVWHALQKVGFALVKSAKAISAHRLHHADVHVGVVMPHERFAIKLDKTGKRVEIMIQQLLAQLRRQVGLGIEQKRSDIVLQRASAAALVIQEKWIAAAQHDIARLEIAIEKVIARGTQQEFSQAAEIVFQRLFVERNVGQPKKIVLEIIQVPGDGLAIETGARIAHLVIQIAAGFDLKAWQHGHNLAVGFNHLGSDSLTQTIFREKLKQRGVAQVFFQISAVTQIFGIDFRHRQSVAAKMPGKFQESNVLFAHLVANSNRAEFFADQPDDITPRAAEMAGQRLRLIYRRAEVLLKKFSENVHEYDFQRFILE